MNKNQTTLYLILLIFPAFISCKKDKGTTKVNYYSSGNLKELNEFLSNGNIYQKTIFYDSIIKIPYKKILNDTISGSDSTIYYYKNGNVYKTWKQDKRNQYFGNFYKFTKEGKLSTIREYFIVNNKGKMNRKWYFNAKGDTTWFASKFNRYDQKEFIGDTSNFRNSTMIPFDFYSKDTIFLNEPFAASVIMNSPLAKEFNSQIMMLLAKENYNYNKTFSNENEVKFDTFYNLNKDYENKANFIGVKKPQYIVVFGRWFTTPGDKIIRGYVREFYFRKKTEKDSSIGGEARVYFEKSIYVKDNLPHSL